MALREAEQRRIETERDRIEQQQLIAESKERVLVASGLAQRQERALQLMQLFSADG